MRFKSPCLVAALLATTLLPAQQDPEPAAATPQARIAALKAKEQAIVKTWIAERQKAMEAARKAREAGETAPTRAISMRPDLSGLIPDYQQAAADFAETDGAVRFLMWLVSDSNDADIAGTAIETLTAHHAASDGLTGMGPMLEYLPRMVSPARSEAFLDAVAERSENTDLLAWVAVSRLGPVIEKAPQDSEEYKQARADLLAAKAAADDERVKSQIQSKIDLRERLGIGNIAPDIQGVDLDGESFSLSDYRGKVVFLDFWGDW